MSHCVHHRSRLRQLGCSIAAGCIVTTSGFTAQASDAFLNLSARGRVDQGENILIGGLVVDRRTNVLLRGVGPSLEPQGVQEPVRRPRLTLFDSAQQPLVHNTGWKSGIPPWSDGTTSQDHPENDAPLETLEFVMAAVGAYPLMDEDAALYLELAPGLYTLHLAADDASPGVGLIEVYLVPDDVDPFSPAWRVRQDQAIGYEPARRGLAPIACVDETSGRTLHLDFAAAFQWNLPAGSSPANHTSSALELTWVSTGTPEIRLGRAGVTDSRGWLASPRYTKTGENTARVACLTTIDAAGHVIREEITLTFTSLASGTFAYEWGTDDTTNDRIAAVFGQTQGAFRWLREPGLGGGSATADSRFFRVFPRAYADDRATARWAVGVMDAGVALTHGDGPDECDANGMREAIITQVGSEYLLHYDGCGTIGWRVCQAVSSDLINWQKNGPMLQLGPAGTNDAACAMSPWIIQDGGTWHMFYFASPNRTPAPDLVPTFPYLTRKAHATSAFGPWTKQPAVIPFDPVPGTFYADVAAPGHVLAHGGGFLQYFSSTVYDGAGTTPLRTLGLARTTNLDGAWAIDPQPLLPTSEQIENSSLYYEPANGLWFLFTNHVAKPTEAGPSGYEYTDAIWMYWSPDPTLWNPEHKAIVLDASSSSWSKAVIGMPSVVPFDGRLAIFHDGNQQRDFGHMRRDIGLAFLALPLQPPTIN